MAPLTDAGVLGWVVPVVFVVGTAALLALLWEPLLYAWPAFVLCLCALGYWQASRIRAARAGESVCSFARSFDARRVDTWILRGVYEALATELSHPVRASDTFADLGIEEEDLEELVGDMAKRVGRSFDVFQDNPLFGKVRSVEDLVLFLQHQPRIGDTG